MYFTIIGIYGNLIGLFLIFLGFRKLVVDFKLITTESNVLMKDPGTPAPASPIPKAPSIYNRTMIEDEASEPAPVKDPSDTPFVVPEPTPAEDPSDAPSVVPEPTPAEDPTSTLPITPKPSLTPDPTIVAPSLTAPKPLDINQKLCPNCKGVVYKTDRVCNNCDADLTQP